MCRYKVNTNEVQATYRLHTNYFRRPIGYHYLYVYHYLYGYHYLYVYMYIYIHTVFNFFKFQRTAFAYLVY